jgi:hypothetical protein
MSMATPVAPQTLYADRLESAIGTLLLIHDRVTSGWEIEETMAEKTQQKDLLSGDVLLLASSSWNTGGIEGQLNPHMWVLLNEKAKTLDLAGKSTHSRGVSGVAFASTERPFTLRETMLFPATRSEANWLMRGSTGLKF